MTQGKEERKEDMEILYLPIGVPTFHLETARRMMQESAQLLLKIWPGTVIPQDILLSVADLKKFLEGKHPDLVILQNATFANSAYACEICGAFSCPILLWTLKEPQADGSRLKLNSLTGAFSAANTILGYGQNVLEYVYGSPEEKEVEEKIKAIVRACRLKLNMSRMRLVQVGQTPEGFGFGRAQDLEMKRTFGVTLESIEARELMNKARTYPDEELAEESKQVEQKMCGLSQMPEKNRIDFVRLYKAYKDYVQEHQVGAMACRCWPDFFTDYGTPVCAVLAMLNDLGIAAACETDAYGALSMYAGMQLTGEPVFFGDPVSMNEEENTLTFWHCGTAACGLAREDTGAQVGVHCNRRIGPTLNFGCKAASAVTIFRIGKSPKGEFRFFLAEGEALDRPRQYEGTSVVVRLQRKVRPMVEQAVCAGWEPHFAVIYGDAKQELTALGHLLGLEVCKYE